jgi:hypothetical protein
MMQSDDGGLIAKLLEPDEVLEVRARAGDVLIAITNRRLAVLDAERIALAVDIESVRRVQFDIEKSRPATLVIVPERPGDPPQVLAVPAEDYEPVANALVAIGRRLANA